MCGVQLARAEAEAVEASAEHTQAMQGMRSEAQAARAARAELATELTRAQEQIIEADAHAKTAAAELAQARLQVRPAHVSRCRPRLRDQADHNTQAEHNKHLPAKDDTPQSGAVWLSLDALHASAKLALTQPMCAVCSSSKLARSIESRLRRCAPPI